MNNLENVKIVFFNYNLEKDVDFKIVSKIKKDETPINKDYVNFIYDVGGNINIELATKLGLGVLEMSDGNRYLYNSYIREDRHDEEIKIEEVMRVIIYHQLEFPSCIDFRLNKIMRKRYIEEVILYDVMRIPDENVIKDLYKILNIRKGNIISFK